MEMIFVDSDLNEIRNNLKEIVDVTDPIIERVKYATLIPRMEEAVKLHNKTYRVQMVLYDYDQEVIFVSITSTKKDEKHVSKSKSPAVRVETLPEV
jgi:hypothetical protein